MVIVSFGQRRGSTVCRLVLRITEIRPECHSSRDGRAAGTGRLAGTRGGTPRRDPPEGATQAGEAPPRSRTVSAAGREGQDVLTMPWPAPAAPTATAAPVGPCFPWRQASAGRPRALRRSPPASGVFARPSRGSSRPGPAGPAVRHPAWRSSWERRSTGRYSRRPSIACNGIATCPRWHCSRPVPC